ncbi:MAG: hypothetical protein ABRQ39_18850 [Candidatus Eremiobacterota bacterium]
MVVSKWKPYLIQDMIDSNFTFYKQINDNPDFSEFLFHWLFERYYKRTLKIKR